MPPENDLEVQLPRSTVAPGDARHALMSFCGHRLEADLLADAALLVSELVTNALRYGKGPIGLRAHVNDDRLLVEVLDEGAGFARERRRRDCEDVGGWGLDIVQDVASRWGMYEGTTHVWFELERPGPRRGEPDS